MESLGGVGLSAGQVQGYGSGNNARGVGEQTNANTCVIDRRFAVDVTVH